MMVKIVNEEPADILKFMLAYLHDIKAKQNADPRSWSDYNTHH